MNVQLAWPCILDSHRPRLKHGSEPSHCHLLIVSQRFQFNVCCCHISSYGCMSSVCDDHAPCALGSIVE